jgi:carbon storage regulator
MLVLSRNVGEGIFIGADVVVQVLKARRGEIRLGITAPAAVPIRRAELPAGRRPKPAPTGAAADPGPKDG